MSIFKTTKKSIALLLALIMLLGIMPVTASAEYETTLAENEEAEPLPDNEPEDDLSVEPPDDGQPGYELPEDRQTNIEQPNSGLPDDDLIEFSENAILSDDIDITDDFKCPNFLAAVRSLEEIKKPYPERILKSDVEKISILWISERNISSLAGIEHFTNLAWLNVRNNRLKELDLGENTKLATLYADANNLTTLNVSNSTALTELWASNNDLATLDVSNNPALGSLYVENNQLKELNVSDSILLGHLFVGFNQLEELNVRNNVALTWINAHENHLTELDVGSNVALERLHVYNNNLEELIVSKNSNLTHLDAHLNNLKELDVRNNPLLEDIHVEDNQLKEMNVGSNTALVTLRVSRNQLNALDVSKNTNLTQLLAGSNNLEVLDVSKNPSLSEINAFSNELTSIILNPDAEYTSIDVSRNRMENKSYIIGRDEIPWDTGVAGFIWFRYSPQRVTQTVPGDITASFTCPNFLAAVRELVGKPTGPILKGDVEGIKYLFANDKNISSLAGIEHFTALKYLEIGINKLTTLDLSNNTELLELIVYDNNITTLDLSKNTKLLELYINGNNLTTLDLSKNTALELFGVEGSKLTKLDLSKNTALVGINLNWNQLTSLDISNNEALEWLEINSNQLTALDVSKNPKLYALAISDNQLTTLDFSNNIALEILFALNNNLITLDVSNNAKLETLNVSRNQLTRINLSNNTALENLYISGNQLTTLDVSNNAALAVIFADNNELTEVILSNTAHYGGIDVRDNRMDDTSAITGRNDIPWDEQISGWISFQFSPQKHNYSYGISLDRTGTRIIASRPFGYTFENQTPLYVTVTNTGNAPTGDLAIALSGENATSFSLSEDSIPSMTAGSRRFFTIVPNTGLTVGTYSAIVTVSGGANIESRSFNVRFTVTKATRDAPPKPVEVSLARTTTSVTLVQGSDIEYAMSLTNRAPFTGWQDNAVFSNLTQNTTHYFFARYKETATHLASAASDPLPVTTNMIPASISISPSYSRATVGQLTTVNLEVDLPPGVDANSIVWSFDDNVFTDESPYNWEAKLRLVAGAPLGSHAVSVAVTIDGVVYRARAEVNIVEETPPIRTARLADITAVINRAKKFDNRSVEVPIVLNYIPADTAVKLYRNYDTNRTEITDLTAELNDKSTAITINTATQTGRNGKFTDITVVIGDVVARGRLNISVIERFPQKLTVRADQLDLFYRNETEVSLVDSDGVEYVVTRITPKNSSAKIDIVGNRVKLQDGARTGSIPVTVEVDSGEYISLKKGNNNLHNINLRVVNNTPSLRLSATTVTLLNDSAGTNSNFKGTATIRLLTRNAKIPFESYYEIESISSFKRDLPAGRNDIKVEVGYEIRDGFAELYISPEGGGNAQAGRTNLEIRFKGAERPVILTLNVRTFNPSSLRPSLSTKTVTVNVNHAPETDIATIPINFNAANLAFPDWRIISVGGGVTETEMNKHIDFNVGDNNMITFGVKDGANLESLLNGKSKNTIPIRIGSPELNSMNGTANTPKKQRTVTVNLVITKTDASFTVSQRGRIDIANPESAIDATIKLQNTSGRILGVRLLEQKRDASGNQIIPTDTSTLFEAVHIPGENTFRIKAIDNVVPRFRYSLAIVVELESGTLTSWRETGVGDRVTYKPNLNITPVQTTSKAWRSADNVTLRAAMPHTGDDIRLNLTTPANVRLGHVNIQQASLDNLYFIKDENGTPIPNALVIEQNGANSWTIRFKDGEVPWGTTNKAGTARTPLKSSYNIRLELWAEGTYVLDGDNPTALGSGKAMSRPTLITVRVNIRPLNMPPTG